MRYNKNGNEFNFAFDITKQIELEKKGINVFKELKNLTDDGAISFIKLDEICSAVLGYSLVDLASFGFKFGDLLGDDGIIMQVIFESDFFSDMRPSASSQESPGAETSNIV